MPEPTRVRDLMRPLPIFEARLRAGEVLRELTQAQAEVGLVHGADGDALLVSDRLRSADPEQPVGELTHPEPPLVVSSDQPLDSVVDAAAFDLVTRPSLPGAIVQLAEGGLAFLPRSALIARANLATRATVDRLEGAPVDLLVFQCPGDGERQIVSYYDPSNPPMCRSGHRMQPVE